RIRDASSLEFDDLHAPRDRFDGKHALTLDARLFHNERVLCIPDFAHGPSVFDLAILLHNASTLIFTAVTLGKTWRDCQLMPSDDKFSRQRSTQRDTGPL